MEMEHCSICTEEINLGTHILLKTGCGHVFHAKCLLKWIRSQEKEECPNCRGTIESMEVYKMNKNFVFQWTHQKINKVKIKIIVFGKQRAVTCMVCRKPMENNKGISCQLCCNIMHGGCGSEMFFKYGLKGKFMCFRCDQLQKESSPCFVCYKPKKENKINCFECNVWSHRECYQTQMVVDEDDDWQCNMCILRHLPVVKNMTVFEQIAAALELGNSPSKWIKKRFDPIFPPEFIEKATQIVNDRTIVTCFERKESLLTALVESCTFAETISGRRSLSVQILQNEDDVVGETEHHMLEFDVLHL